MRLGLKPAYGDAIPVYSIYGAANNPASTVTNNKMDRDAYNNLTRLGLLEAPRGAHLGGTNSITASFTATLAPRMTYGSFKTGAVGNNVFALIDTDGKLYTWGSSTTGLGRTVTGGNQIQILQVGSGTDWAKVATGLDWGLAIKTDGTLWSWGANTNGKTGQNTTTGTTTTPTQIGSATNWTLIAAADSSGYAVNSSNELWTWGLGVNTGQNLSTGTVNVPTQVTTSVGTISFITGLGNNAALIGSGALYTTGSNVNAATGLGSTTGNTIVFTQVGARTDWVKFTLGTFVCAGICSGTTGYWGWTVTTSTFRELAFDFNSTSSTPVNVRTGNTYVDIISCGLQAASCGVLAIRDDGALWQMGAGNPSGFGVSATAGVNSGTIRLTDIEVISGTASWMIIYK